MHIYLTFDDGPYCCSEYLLTVTETEKIPITVFVIGENVLKSKERRDIFESYKLDTLIEIGNHSFSHANKKYKAFYKNATAVLADFKKNEDVLHLSKSIARLPGRNTWRINNRKKTDLTDADSAANLLANKGYNIFGWDLAWFYDSTMRSTKSAEEMFDDVVQLVNTKKSFAANKIVILCHDPMLENPYSKDQLLAFIRRVKSKSGWQFSKISQYDEDPAP